MKNALQEKACFVGLLCRRRENATMILVVLIDLIPRHDQILMTQSWIKSLEINEFRNRLENPVI